MVRVWAFIFLNNTSIKRKQDKKEVLRDWYMKEQLKEVSGREIGHMKIIERKINILEHGKWMNLFRNDQ